MPNVDQVRAEATKMWGSVDRFVSDGFGYCVTSNGVVTSWSLNECPSARGSVSESRPLRSTSEKAMPRQPPPARCCGASRRLVARLGSVGAQHSLNETAERLGLTRVAE
jgi:hypothetical protein